MSKHIVTRTFPFSRATVARKRGRKVRYFDAQTARMSGWVTDPNAAPVVETSIPETETATATVAVSNYSRMLKPELVELAKSRGVAGYSKMAKPALIAALQG